MDFSQIRQSEVHSLITPPTGSRHGGTHIIVIITVALIVTVIGFVVHGYLQNKKKDEIQKNYSPCYQSLCVLEKALMEYGREHKGHYPKKLGDLTPTYIKSIPTCPQAHKDSYSASYLAITDRPMYFIACEGHNHPGPDDTPQTLSDPGFLSEKAENPMTVVYENGHMKDIMRLMEESNMLMKKGKYKDALDPQKKMLKIQKAKRNEVYLKMAKAYFSLEDDRKALDCLNDAIEIKFELQEWLMLEKWLFKDDNRSQVIRILSKYFKSHGDDVSCALLLTTLLEKSDKADEANRIYKELIESGAAAQLSPVAEIFFSAMILRHEGKNDEALATLTSIRDIQTENLPAENYLCSLSEEYIREMKTKETKEKE
jgi:tetratricopeptide (TPR) repeat protein